ncbi:MAG: TonB-dependent receptor [Gammaproteobacteria bacterium]
MNGDLPKPWLFRGGVKRNLDTAFWLLSAVFSIPVHAAAQSDLTAMSLESLMDVEVTSAAKRPQQLHEATTAIYVISGEDIRRSGVTTLAEALRLAPGVDVARATNNQWSVTIRGLPFNKLLVLIDGRSIYSLLNAGVFWNQHDALLSDIDRIEVIRGPGGTLWGANAVNGVINIITKSAENTQGGQVQAGAGSEGDVIGSLRYGGELGRNAHYRVYGKYSDHGSLELSDGSDARDDWQLGQLGGRLDWRPTSRDAVTVQGDFFRNEFDTLSFLPLTSFFQPLPAVDTTEQYGGNVLVRWERETDHAGRVSLQSYFDWLDAESIIATFDTKTWDVEFEHELSVHERMDLIWGLGYRLLSYDSQASLALDPDPLGQDLNWFTGFLQSDIDLTDTLRVTLGSKFEHNDITGFEYQPNLRLLWHPHENHAVWASVSRAVRTPAPSDRRVRFNFAMLPGTPPVLFSSLPNLDLESEELIAWELGYRPKITNNLSLDVTAFYFDYDKLLAGTALPPVFETEPPPPHLLFGFQADNLMHGEIYGLEGVLHWRANEHWRMEASYSFKKLALHADDPAVLDMPGFGGPSDIEKSSPQQQFQIRSYLDLARNVEADVSLFYVDRIPALNVDDYLRLDLHLGWRPLPDLSLDLYARNLLEDNHTEPGNLFGAASRIPRSVFGRVTWRW